VPVTSLNGPWNLVLDITPNPKLIIAAAALSLPDSQFQVLEVDILDTAGPMYLIWLPGQTKSMST
jgi:hypothetical protein